MCYNQLMFDKNLQNTQWGKIVSSTNDIGKIGYLHAKEFSLTHLTPSTKINSK